MPFGRLKAEGFDVTLFFYNPNIQPATEHDRRLKELERFADEEGMPLVVDREDREKWKELTRGMENELEGGKRCLVCYRMRMEKTAQYAEKNGFATFATSLTLSPHKNAQAINKIGQELAGQHGLEYYASDFKKQAGFKESLAQSREHDFYRQDYCGCEFSKVVRKNS